MSRSRSRSVPPSAAIAVAMALAVMASVEPSAGIIEVSHLARLSVRSSERQAMAVWLASLGRVTRELHRDQSLSHAADLSRQAAARSAAVAPRVHWMPVDRQCTFSRSPLIPAILDLPPPVEHA